jgi:hypothetical protein
VTGRKEQMDVEFRGITDSLPGATGQVIYPRRTAQLSRKGNKIPQWVTVLDEDGWSVSMAGN